MMKQKHCLLRRFSKFATPGERKVTLTSAAFELATFENTTHVSRKPDGSRIPRTCSTSPGHAVRPQDMQYVPRTCSTSPGHAVRPQDMQYVPRTCSTSPEHAVRPQDTQYLENSVVSLMMCNARGLTPDGRFFSASLKGMHSPVSKFRTTTCWSISCLRK